MSKSAFRHYKLNQQDRKTMAVTQFLGVDYSTQRFNVSSYRAIDCKNFIYRNGVVQSRKGLETIAVAENVKYVASSFESPQTALYEEIRTNTANVNGLWRFDAEDGQSHIVAHVGKLLMEVVGYGTENCRFSPFTNGTHSVGSEMASLCHEFEDFGSSAFVGGKKLWFLGGNRMMVIRFLKGGITLVEPVEESGLAPIPTTTISITCKNALATNRQTLDGANLMTRWRYNKLITGTGRSDLSSEDDLYEYTLDAPLICREDGDMADIEITLEESGMVGEEEENENA